MFKFYLRQTTPFEIRDILNIFSLFLKRKNITVDILEKKISNMITTKYCVLTPSLRVGLTKALKFYKLKRDKNEIILPEYSFHSNLSSALDVGYKIKFAPNSKGSIEIDLNKLPETINNNTLGIIVSHLHGHHCKMNKLTSITSKHKIIIFEDCAHVFGDSFDNKKIGSFGIGLFSFGAGKNVSSFGGGAVCTNNINLYKYLKKHQVVNNNIIKDVLILAKTILYIFITNPFIAFLVVKPILGITYFLRINFKRDYYNRNKVNCNNFVTPSPFQISLLNYQISNLNERIEKIKYKRLKISSLYNRFFNNNLLKNNDNYFQYPISVNDPIKFINKCWKYNLDVQKDYCDYLPNIYYKSKSCGKNKSYFNTIVYLPVNYHIKFSELEIKLKKIFNK
jgi:hypothetical protein